MYLTLSFVSKIGPAYAPELVTLVKSFKPVLSHEHLSLHKS